VTAEDIASGAFDAYHELDKAFADVPLDYDTVTLRMDILGEVVAMSARGVVPYTVDALLDTADKLYAWVVAKAE
jgi:hypothetical protein